jgi:PAS domain S-box-containing protein
MKSLRSQLLFSHLVLVALMALLMVGATVNFLALGRSIDRILRDNYASVVAAQDMKDALERIDSAAIFVVAGQTQRARTQYAKNLVLFQNALAAEQSNITEAGEQVLAREVAQQFPPYKQRVERLLTAPPTSEAARATYFGVLEPQFVQLSQRVQKILSLNQAAMQRRDAEAKAMARRATLVGVALTLGTLLLALIFTRQAINSALTPLLALAQGAQQIGAGHLNRSIELRRNDEIGLVAGAFNDMAAKLRAASREQQQRLHRAEKMSDAALEALYDPVIVTDATGAVVHFNQAAEALFGPAAGAAGRPAAQVVGEEHITAAIERAIRSDQISADESEAALASLDVDGVARTFRLRATPMRDEEADTTLGAALVLEDITELSELSRLKTEFIGVASHELRTPVTSLMLSAQLLQEGAAGELNEDQHEIVAAQREDLARLDALMRDLLDITRLEAGTTAPRLHSTSPREMVERAQAAVAPQARAQGIELQVLAGDDLPQVLADSGQIERVLVNLLSNAIRHTPSGGTVRIEARGSSSSKRVLLRVADTGEGIPPEYLGRIFSRFVQVPGATRGGAGLGLSIAQQIVKSHRSEIEVHSEIGKGSAFEFELEAGPQAGSQAAKEQR